MWNNLLKCEFAGVCMCVLFVLLCSENVHQLGSHIGAQMAHHRAGERTPFGLRAKLLQHSCNDASSRCCSGSTRGAGEVSQTHILTRICVCGHGLVIRLSLKMDSSFPGWVQR